MKKYVFGIDPGYKGGITKIDLSQNTLMAWATPIIRGNPKKNIKDQYDIPGMSSYLDVDPAEVYAVFIEQVNAMPGQGVTSMFNFGMGYGIWLGIIGCHGHECRRTLPRIWKKEFELNQDKDASREAATRLFPACASLWKLKKHDGIAESSLIAYYGVKTLQLVFENPSLGA